MPLPLIATLGIALIAGTPPAAQEDTPAPAAPEAGTAAPEPAPDAAPGTATPPAPETAPAPEAAPVPETAPAVDLDALMVAAPWPRPMPLSDGRSGLSDRVAIEVGGAPVYGTLALPPDGPAPVVLLLHGFLGDREELEVGDTGEGAFRRAARLLAEAGYASLRIDFRGSGESDEGAAFADTTFEGQIADARAALDRLAGDDRVSGPAFVIGWGQGGLVAAGLAGGGAEIEAMALWAGIADPQITFATLFGPRALEQGVLSEGASTVALPWGAEVTLGQKFFEGVLDADPLADIARYDGPLFVAQGSEDATVDPAQAEMWLSAHGGPDELWLREMDHGLGLDDGPERFDELVAATIAFFDMLGAP